MGWKTLTQTVVDTSRVVTNGFGSPGTDKDGAGVLGHVSDGDGVLDLQDQVLGGVLVAELHGLFDGFDDESDGVVDGATNDIHTRESLGLTVELVFDGEKF